MSRAICRGFMVLLGTGLPSFWGAVLHQKIGLILDLFHRYLLLEG